MMLPDEILHRALFASIHNYPNSTTSEWKLNTCCLNSDTHFEKWDRSLQFRIVQLLHPDDDDALMHCARNGKTDLCRYIIQKKHSNTINTETMKVLFEVAVKGGDHVNTVRYLIESFDGIPYPTANEMLKFAAKHGRANVCRFLIVDAPEQKRCKANDNDEVALKLAVHNEESKDHVDVCKVLVEEGPQQTRCTGILTDRFGDKCNVLHIACKKGCLRVCRYFSCEAPQNVKIKPSEWNLQNAADFGHIAICEFLARDAPPDVRVKPPTMALAWAAHNGHADICRLFVFDLPEDMRVKPNASNHIALQYAAARGHIDICHMLAREAPSKIRARASTNPGILMGAVSNSHVDVCLFLIREAGARPNAMNHKALFRAVEGFRADREICRILMHEGKPKYRASAQYLLDHHSNELIEDQFIKQISFVKSLIRDDDDVVDDQS